MDSYHYLLIGNSAGSVGAVEAIRSVDKSDSLAMVSEEPSPPYSRPLISELLAGERDLDSILYRSGQFYKEHGVTPPLGATAQKLDVERHTVQLSDGKIINWCKLLLATGGMPIFPPTEGNDKQGVFTFTTLKDALAIRQWLERARSTVVIGGGLIGVSVTDALHKTGVKVTMIELKDWILNTIMDKDAADIVQARLDDAGVQVVTGRYVKSIVGNGYRADTVGGVVLDDGRSIPCDMVVVAIGVVPRTELAKNAAIKVNRGITVDRTMRTSHPDVYACGDAAEAYDFLLGTDRVIPIWPSAYLGGRTAGFNMAGKGVTYSGSTPMNSLKYFGLPIVAAGMFITPPGDEYETIAVAEKDHYRKLVLRNGTIVGMTFIGDISRAGIVFNLMRDSIDVSKYKSDLLADDLGVASLPKDIWQGWMQRATGSPIPEPAYQWP